jgi:hypothetical protein
MLLGIQFLKDGETRGVDWRQGGPRQLQFFGFRLMLRHLDSPLGQDRELDGGFVLMEP